MQAEGILFLFRFVERVKSIAKIDVDRRAGDREAAVANPAAIGSIAANAHSRIDDPDLGDPEGKVVLDAFLHFGLADLGREDLDGDEMGAGENLLDSQAARKDANVSKPQERHFASIRACRDTGRIPKRYGRLFPELA